MMSTYPVITASNRPEHVGMTPRFFDDGVRRAFEAGICIQRTSRASIVAVSSSTDADVSYLVSRTSCSCEGARRHNRCLHRAFACFYFWCLEQDHIAAQTEKERA